MRCFKLAMLSLTFLVLGCQTREIDEKKYDQFKKKFQSSTIEKEKLSKIETQVDSTIKFSERSMIKDSINLLKKRKEKFLVEDKNHSSKKTQNQVSKNLIDKSNYETKINIYDSYLYFDFNIISIKLKEVPNYFTITKEKYTKPITKSGFELIVKFEVTNPYDKEYSVPIPNHYYVRSSSESFKSLPKVNYDRKKNDYYYFTNQLNDKNGDWIIKKSDLGGINFDFKAKEGKMFQVKFKPVTKEVRQLVFGGINSEFQRYNLEKNSSNIKEVWFILDLENKKVVNKYSEGGYKSY